MRALLHLLRPAVRQLVSGCANSTTPQRFLASPWRAGWRRGFTATPVLSTVYEDVRRERRLKKHRKLIRLGLKKRKRRKKRRGKGIWTEPCEAEQQRAKDHSRCIIAPYADEQMWPKLTRERDRRYAVKALNTTLAHFGQLNSMFRRE